MKLYVYDHCPYCIKPRMIFSLKNIPVEIKVLLNDDEKTPISMVGKKMVPILEQQDGSFMPESMDIVRFIDKSDGKPLLTGATNAAIATWLRNVSQYTSRLLLPRFAAAPLEEFATAKARKYFSDKKQAASGAFQEHLKHSDGLVKQISQDLLALDELIVEPNAVNGELSEDDIHLWPLLRSLSIVQGIEWPSRVQAYRDNMAKQTEVNLFTAIAR